MIAPAADPSAVVAGYQAAFRRLRDLPGFTPALALRAEAGVILKTWAGRTKVSTLGAAERSARARALYAITYRGRASANAGFLTINSGRRGGIPGQMWRRTRRGKFQSAGYMDLRTGAHRWSWIHFPKDDWPEMQAATATAANNLRTMLPAARRSIGLSRQSVLQIADALGLDLTRVQGGGALSSAGLAKARAALASDGRTYRNGTGHQAGGAVSAYVTLINTLPYGRKLGMDRTLLGVLAGRAGFIERLYGLGVFGSQAKVARAFPNFIAVQSAN